ncbi:MAG TPA: (Fe-S)-binding protein [Chloroflexota bacterium]|nr:(Fe-S)-binding protein [Chloroflexota bacterium]
MGRQFGPSKPSSRCSSDPAGALAAEYDNLLACVRCGLCLTSCPTYVLAAHEAEGPRGRIAMLRALAEGRLALTPDLVRHERSCLVCDACTAVCPAGVRMGPLQVAFRAAIARVAPRPLWQRALRRVLLRGLFAHPVALRLVVRLLWLYQRSGAQALARRSGLLRLLGLAEREALLPPVPRRFVVPRGETYAALSTQRSALVALFAGCVMATGLAEIDRATIRVLRRAGCDVVSPAGQGCCGALHAHAGDLAGARALARRNVAAFEAAGAAPIVVNAAGCSAMLKEYPHYLADDPAWAARARAFAARARDVTEYLAARLDALRFPSPPRGPAAVSVTYQDPCHLAHAQGIREPPRALLRAIPGLALRELGDGGLCCGSAGVYNVTNPAEARRLQQRKLDAALATDADVVATANPGCLLQLRAGLAARGSRVQVRHVVELLDAALGEDS